MQERRIGHNVPSVTTPGFRIEAQGDVIGRFSPCLQWHQMPQCAPDVLATWRPFSVVAVVVFLAAVEHHSGKSFQPIEWNGPHWYFSGTITQRSFDHRSSLFGN